MNGGEALDYCFEMLAAMREADDCTRFLIQAHIGNHSLFLTGIFPERIRFRTHRKASPDLKYYEELGRNSFRHASDHRLARKYELTRIFGQLAESFAETRLALNDLTERLLSLGEPEPPLRTLVLPDSDVP